MAEAVESAVTSSPTLKVTVDCKLLQRIILQKHGVKVDTAQISPVLAQEAPRLGFTCIGLDSTDRRQYQRPNPKFVMCRRHRCKATLVRLYRKGGLELRAKHWTGGISFSCYFGFISSVKLERFMPTPPMTSDVPEVAPVRDRAPLEAGAVGGEL